MKTVKNSVALVTGANRGIGRSIVEEFLDAGAAKVYAAARNLESLNVLLSQYGDRVLPIHIDLNEPETIKQAAANAPDVQIVVNNAGMLNVANPLANNAIDAMKQGTLNVTRHWIMSSVTPSSTICRHVTCNSGTSNISSVRASTVPVPWGL